VDRALWLLLWLRLRGWVRRLGRSTNTVRGVVLLIAGVLFFACIFINPILSYFLGLGGEDRPQSLDRMQYVGTLSLFGYCVLTLLLSSHERAIYFSPAEVNFLFSGPFTRRQLLAYKIVAAFFTCLVSGLFMMVFTISHGAWPPAAYLGVVLTLFFLSLFGMAVSLIGNTLGARANTRRRQLVLAGLLALVLAVGLSLGRNLVPASWDELLERVQASPVLQGVLMPLSWFVKATTAQALWPDLVEYAGLSAAVDLLLMVLVFALDWNYLEASSAASERIYARLQRARSGGGAFAAWRSSTTKPRFSLPSLPWWGGVGPTAWRQLVTAVRSLRGLLIFLVIFGGILVIMPLALALGGDHPREPGVGKIVAGSLLGISLVSLPAMMAFDFRGDLDRMDLLKSLPISAWRLAIGQLLAPVLLLSMIQLGALACIQGLWGEMEAIIPYVVLAAWPGDFLAFAVDNLMFLWFPSRQTVATPGDFQLMGRQLVMLLAKFLVLGVPAVVAGVAGGLVLHLSGQHWLAAAVVALVLTGFAVPLVPVLAAAFRNFDVSRDMPP
jgi:hypothetical protein